MTSFQRLSRSDALVRLFPMQIVALSSGNGWHVEDLARAARGLGHNLTACPWRILTGTVGNGAIARAGDVVLDNADAVLLRTMPAGSLEQIIFRMDLIQRLAIKGVPVFNPPGAVEAAVDKYLALARIHAAGLPIPPTIACQRLSDALLAFDQLGGDVVIKPLFGSEGFGMTRVSDADTAARVFAALERINAVIYLQRFVPHDGSDFRFFVLGDRVLAAMRRRNGTDWRTNVARGGRGETIVPEQVLCDLALRAAAACGAVIAGVDVVIDPEHGPLVLEVNAVPGWRELARVTGVDVAAEVLSYVAERSKR